MGGEMGERAHRAVGQERLQQANTVVAAAVAADAGAAATMFGSAQKGGEGHVTEHAFAGLQVGIPDQLWRRLQLLHAAVSIADVQLCTTGKDTPEFSLSVEII